MSIGGASNAPPPGPPVSVPRFGFTPNVPLKERESQEQRDKDNRSGDNKATSSSTPALRVETTNRDQQPQKQDRSKPEEPNQARVELNLGGRRSPPPPITVPPLSAAGNAPLSGSSSTSRPYSPTLPPANQQHQPYYHQSQSQPLQQPQQQSQQQQQPSQPSQPSHPSQSLQQQQGPPSGPRGAPPPTGPRANNSSVPPPRGPGGFDRERERTDVRAREPGAVNKWGAPREKAEAIQQAAPYFSPETSMIHPDRLKGIEKAERSEPPKDRDTNTISLQPPSSTIPPLRQEQKHPQHQQAHQQHHRGPIGLVSTSASATGGDNSHDTSPGSHNNSVVGGDSSLSWNPSRPPAHASISPSMAHKPLPPQPQTAIHPSASSDKSQHSLNSILNPDGVGSNGGYAYGSPATISAVNTNNNVNLSTSNITATSITTATGTGYVTTTTATINTSASTNPSFMSAQQSSPQAAPPTNVPSTPTMSTATLVISAASPPVAASASLSPQMPVKQVPTGPRAERANPHLPHGHSHNHLHMNRGRVYWNARGGGFRGRGGEGPGMPVKREFDDDSQASMGLGYRGGRGDRKSVV